VVIQSVTSKRALANSRGEPQEIVTETGTPWVRNTCHIWAEGGVGEQKLAAGWRPGIGVYPSPPLKEIIEAGRSDSAEQ
jgi:hypothetical protein